MCAAGVPESGACQEILHWQANTVGMMYSLIADAIKAKGAPLPCKAALEPLAPVSCSVTSAVYCLG